MADNLNAFELGKWVFWYEILEVWLGSCKWLAPWWAELQFMAPSILKGLVWTLILRGYEEFRVTFNSIASKEAADGCGFKARTVSSFRWNSGEWLHLSEPPFPHLSNGHRSPTSWAGLSEIIEKYLSNTYYVWGAILGAGDLVVSKTSHKHHRAHILGGLHENTENKFK